MSTFRNSPVIAEIIARLGTVEGDIGVGAPENLYETVAEIRALTVYDDGYWAFFTETETSYYVYRFNDSNTEGDNGTTVLKPDNITSGNPGRWVRRAGLSIDTHNHDAIYVKIPDIATGNLLILQDGELVDTGIDPDNLVEDADYVQTELSFTQDHEDDITANTEAIENKIDRLEPTVGQLGNLLEVDENGNPQISTNYPHANYTHSSVITTSGDIDFTLSDFDMLIIDMLQLVWASGTLRVWDIKFEKTAENTWEQIDGSDNCAEIDYTLSVVYQNESVLLRITLNGDFAADSVVIKYRGAII